MDSANQTEMLTIGAVINDLFDVQALIEITKSNLEDDIDHDLDARVLRIASSKINNLAEALDRVGLELIKNRGEA